MFVVNINFLSDSPGVAVAEPMSPCDGSCLRCGLPIRSATIPSPRCAAPLPVERPPSTDPTGSRSCDVTFGARRDSKDNRRCVTFADDADGRCSVAAARKRVRFAPPTDDVKDDVSRQLEPVTPTPPLPLPGASFVQMQTVGLPPSTSAELSTFVGLRGDASIV